MIENILFFYSIQNFKFKFTSSTCRNAVPFDCLYICVGGWPNLLLKHCLNEVYQSKRPLYCLEPGGLSANLMDDKDMDDDDDDDGDFDENDPQLLVRLLQNVTS